MIISKNHKTGKTEKKIGTKNLSGFYFVQSKCFCLVFAKFSAKYLVTWWLTKSPTSNPPLILSGRLEFLSSFIILTLVAIMRKTRRYLILLRNIFYDTCFFLESFIPWFTFG